MTSKEMAQKLVDRFSTVGLQQRNEGIGCSFIFIDLLFSLDIRFDRDGVMYDEISIDEEYWNEVKKEIEKL